MAELSKPDLLSSFNKDACPLFRSLTKYNAQVDKDTNLFNKAITAANKAHDTQISALRKALDLTIKQLNKTIKDRGRLISAIVLAQQTEDGLEEVADVDLGTQKLLFRTILEAALFKDDSQHQVDIKQCCANAKLICPTITC